MVKTRNGKTVVLNRVTAPKPYDLLADQLREAILKGDIAEGDTLPPERELVEQTGLTRGSVREALRLLAAEGLVQARPGRFGGNVVTLPGNESVANSITHFIRGRRLRLSRLHETREVLEPGLARLAALHRTDEDLDALNLLHARLIAASDNFQRFSLANIEWHKAVARASGNELLAAILHVIAYGVAVSTTIEEYDTPDTRQQVIRIHAQITAAIQAHDADTAEQRMRQHIRATHARVAGPETTEVPMSADDVAKPGRRRPLGSSNPRRQTAVAKAATDRRPLPRET